MECYPWSMRRERLGLGAISLAVLIAPLLACSGGAAQTPTAEPARVSSVVVPAEPPPEATALSASEDEEEPSPAPVSSQAPREAHPNPSAADLATARKLFQEGVQAFQQADYVTARDRFEAAYQIVPKAPVLYNLARAEQQLGNQRKACEYLAAWVRDGSAHPAQLQSASAELQKCGINP